MKTSTVLLLAGAAVAGFVLYKVATRPTTVPPSAPAANAGRSTQDRLIDAGINAGGQLLDWWLGEDHSTFKSPSLMV